MGDEDEIGERSTAPKGPDEWKIVWRGVTRANRAWIIIGPIYAVMSNLKAIAFVLLLILYINRPEILAAIEALFGVKE